MIYTFYSYKGGVGRSMALANIAECFREKHLRVLMVDWDLEAPGLETYFYPGGSRNSDEPLNQARRNPGLIDMLSEYKEAFPRFAEQRSPSRAASVEPGTASRQAGQEELDRARNALEEQLKGLEMSDFLRASAIQTLSAPATKAEEADDNLPAFLERLYRNAAGPALMNRDVGASPLGRYIQRVHETEGLYLLSAGARGAEDFKGYAAKVQDFDWAEFYAVFDGRHYFEWLRSKFAEIADVILIDSRTGVTEMGGVCTRQMADAVVSFCAPNGQNVDGVVRIIAGLNDASVRAARGDREIDVMIIPTRVDDAESALLDEFRVRFTLAAEQETVPAQFGKMENPLWNLRIPYIPRYNYREQRAIGPNSATSDPPTERLIAAYRKITVHLAVLAGREQSDLKVKEAFNADIALQFPHLGPSQAPRIGPRPPTAYVHRRGVEQQLTELLLRATSRPHGGDRVGVSGRAGTGKTALVAFVTSLPEIEARFPDGTVWLSGDRVWSPDAISAFFRSSFGIPASYREAAVSEFLAGRRFLTVIDDLREQSAIDRIANMGKNATCLLITRDSSLCVRFSGHFLDVSDFSPEESEQLIGASHSALPLASDDDPLGALITAFALWPAGAAALRAVLELNRGRSSEFSWRGIVDGLRNLGASSLDALTSQASGGAIPRSIRDAVGQLEPPVRRLLIALAQGDTAALTSANTSTNPDLPVSVRRLHDFGLLKGDRTVHPIVRLWLIYTGDLADPIAQAQSASEAPVRENSENDRTRARDILRGASTAVEETLALAERMKKVRSFSVARRLLARARQSPDFLKVRESLRLKVIQQHALCTYRDADLPAGERYSYAINILRAGDLSSPQPCQETLGLAGAVYKNLWRQSGQRKNLEHSFNYYEQGATGELAGDYGYTRINAAFVLDVLASQEADDDGASSELRRAHARRLRQEIADKLPGLAGSPECAFLRQQWWYFATLAEACFGLGQFEASRFWLRSGLALSVPEWEKESTARQLADLAWAQNLTLEEGSEEWQTLRVLVGDAVDALRAVAAGKVGLALSGGGFRASLFHIGVFAKLAEADLLRHVEVLSCVSGGSIVGAHLYLELRHLLESKPDHEITREDYVEIVRRIQRDFLDGVQMNLRTMLFRSWFANVRTLFQPGYTRTHRLGAMFEEHLYSRVKDGHKGPRYLRKLRIEPKGAGASFNPKLDNWRRSARVPILLLNATTLNTGHNWQFAVTWMGEPPADGTSVDCNDILRRMYYEDEAPSQYQDVPLGLAVAASACVPALFDPVEMPNLYPDRLIRLVDGGVHDNQGTAGLLEQECRVMLVSDASGHMNSERHPGAEVLSVPLRANSILMARVREAEYREIDALNRSSALTGVMFLHLKKDLLVNHVNWIECEDPYEPLDEGHASERKTNTTSYGIPRATQGLLAGIRTDLDSFSDVEAYALMLSGYRMAEGEIKTGIASLAVSNGAREPWDFLTVEGDLRDDQGVSSGSARITKILKVASSRGLKVWRLSGAAVAIGSALAAAIVYVAMPAIAILPGLAAMYLLAVGIFAMLLWVMHRAFRSRKSFTVLVTGTLMATFGWIVAAFHLALFDPLYRRAGRVKVRDRRPSVKTDKVSIGIAAVVLVIMIAVGIARWLPTPPLADPNGPAALSK